MPSPAQLRCVLAATVALIACAAHAAPDRGALDKALKSSRDVAREDELVTCLRESCPTPGGADIVLIALNEGASSQRLIAAGVAAESLPPAALAKLSTKLPPSTYPDERRWLIRAVGRRAGEVSSSDRKAVIDLLESEARSSNPAMRQAAIASLADLGSVESLDLLVGQVTIVPGMQETWNSDRESPVQMARLGAVESLTGRRFQTVKDLRSWWGDNAAKVKGATPDADPWGKAHPAPLDVTRAGVLTRSFLVSTQDWPRGEVNAAFADAVDAAAAASRASAASVFGPVHLPLIKMAVAEKNAFAKYGATSSNYFGYAQGQRIVMQPPAGQLSVFAGVLVHEYGHIIHQAHYASQPRWISEGLAESIAKSAKGSPYAGRGERLGEALRQRLRGGAVTGLVLWTASGSTNESPDLYAHAHIAVDFLRFGPIPEAAARFNALMGRLDRGESATSALKAVYGREPKDLDALMLKWLGVSGGPAK